jgi:hypothetical protein
MGKGVGFTVHRADGVSRPYWFDEYESLFPRSEFWDEHEIALP